MAHDHLIAIVDDDESVRDAATHLFRSMGFAAVAFASAEDFLNSGSLEVVRTAQLEPSLRATLPGAAVQFERLGYFVADEHDSRPGAPVFNRIVTLRDTWARIEQAQRARA